MWETWAWYIHLWPLARWNTRCQKPGQTDKWRSVRLVLCRLRRTRSRSCWLSTLVGCLLRSPNIFPPCLTFSQAMSYFRYYLLFAFYKYPWSTPYIFNWITQDLWTHNNLNRKEHCTPIWRSPVTSLRCPCSTKHEKEVWWFLNTI